MLAASGPLLQQKAHKVAMAPFAMPGERQS